MKSQALQTLFVAGAALAALSLTACSKPAENAATTDNTAAMSAENSAMNTSAAENTGAMNAATNTSGGSQDNGQH
ncbi:MAG: hypothetical protein ACREEB_17815 [Caulobacteraceae bacterium]